MGLAAALGGGVAGAIGAGAIITGGAGLASAAISGSAAQSAAKTQANAEQNAAQIQAQQFQQTQGYLAPYNAAGQSATDAITGMQPFSFAPTQAQLEATPGYQFNLSQGLKATQNGYAAQGLGTSGAAIKGAGQYASGLADTTYQNQFQNALTTYNTQLAKLQGQASLGENAAANVGNFGTQVASNIGQTAVGAANATAAGTVGAAKATASGLGSLSYLGNQFGASPVTAGGGSGIYSNGFTSSLPTQTDPSITGITF